MALWIFYSSDMLHESGQRSSPNYKISSGSMSLIKDPSLPVPAPSVLCCIKTPAVSVRPLMLKAAQRCSHRNINDENLGWMEIQVTPSEFRHIKATVCLRQLSFFAIHFEYIRLMKESERQWNDGSVPNCLSIHHTVDALHSQNALWHQSIHFNPDLHQTVQELFSLQK